MPGERSICPIAHVLDIVGDRWTLLVVRDIALLGKHRFSELAASPEKIQPSTLTDRLSRLVSGGILNKTRIPGGPGRQYRYDLTARGLDLVPLLAAAMQWSVRNDPDTAVSGALGVRLEQGLDEVVADMRRKITEATAS